MNEREYEYLLAILDALIDGIEENEDHPLAPLMDEIGIFIEKYEDKYIPKTT